MKTSNFKFQQLAQLFRRVAQNPRIRMTYTESDAARDGLEMSAVRQLAGTHGLMINRAGLLTPLSPPPSKGYWPDEAQRLAAENRELRATLRRRDCDIALYQAATLVAVLGCILLAMGV